MRYFCGLIVLWSVASGIIADASHLGDDLGDDILRDLFRHVPSDVKRWPGGVVPYDFHKTVQNDTRKIRIVEEVMGEVQKYLSSGDTPCIRFRKRTNADVHYLHVESYGHFTCAATVGYAINQLFPPSMNVATCSRRSIYHELMHVLGFLHEHQRPDRDTYISIDWKSADYSSSFGILKNTNNQSLPYDLGSITHYPVHIKPKNRDYLGGERAAFGRPMSDLDIIRVQKLYSCKEDLSSLHRYFPADIVYKCSFEDFCNMTQITKYGTVWSRGDTKIKVTTNGKTTKQIYNSYLYFDAKKYPGKLGAIRTPVFEKGIYCASLAVSPYGFRGGSARLSVQTVPTRSKLPTSQLTVSWYATGWEVYRIKAFNMTTPWYLRLEARAAQNETFRKLKIRNIEVRDLVIMRC